MPHDPVTLFENKKCKIEKCKLCGKRIRFNKGFKGRVDNIEYLQFHVRKFAQPNGSTKRVYLKMHDPESLVIKI